MVSDSIDQVRLQLQKARDQSPFAQPYGSIPSFANLRGKSALKGRVKNDISRVSTTSSTTSSFSLSASESEASTSSSSYEDRTSGYSTSWSSLDNENKGTPDSVVDKRSPLFADEDDCLDGGSRFGEQGFACGQVDLFLSGWCDDTTGLQSQGVVSPTDPSTSYHHPPRRRSSVPQIAITDPLTSAAASYSDVPERDSPPLFPKHESRPHRRTSTGQSLLSKSLRSLKRLPNLGLSFQLPSMNFHSVSFDWPREVTLPFGRGPFNGSSMASIARVQKPHSDPSPDPSFRGPPGGRDSKGSGHNGWGASDEDPELEWSSMVVQLQTFSTTVPDTDPEPSRGTEGTSSSSTSIGHGSPPPSPGLPATPPRPRTRVLSNSRHLLMITLELNMMRERKIRAPLRVRSVTVVEGIPWPLRIKAGPYKIPASSLQNSL